MFSFFKSSKTKKIDKKKDILIQKLANDEKKQKTETQAANVGVYLEESASRVHSVEESGSPMPQRTVSPTRRQ